MTCPEEVESPFGSVDLLGTSLTSSAEPPQLIFRGKLRLTRSKLHPSMFPVTSSDGKLKEENFVKRIYSSFSDDQVSAKVAELLTHDKINAEVTIIFRR